MSSKDLENARGFLRHDDWGVKTSKSLAIGGAWLLSLEGTDEEGDDKIEIFRLTLAEMEGLRSEFPDKFKRSK